jgi:hypothetical protein
LFHLTVDQQISLGWRLIAQTLPNRAGETIGKTNAMKWNISDCARRRCAKPTQSADLLAGKPTRLKKTRVSIPGHHTVTAAQTPKTAPQR